MSRSSDPPPFSLPLSWHLDLPAVMAVWYSAGKLPMFLSSRRLMQGGVCSPLPGDGPVGPECEMETWGRNPLSEVCYIPHWRPLGWVLAVWSMCASMRLGYLSVG